MQPGGRLMTSPSADEIAALYREWWLASYPNNPPNPQAVANAVAFVQYLQRQCDG